MFGSSLEKRLDSELDASLIKYGNISGEMDEIERDFADYTRLDKADIPFLFLATALQCVRVYVIDAITQKERAGHKNRNEKRLHDFQKTVYKKLGFQDIGNDQLYFASLNHIISTVGVPYDATAFVNEKTMEQMRKKSIELLFDPETKFAPDSRIFKGANHRFSTLGHDPYLGLIFGTANIMTNTITTNNGPVIKTNHVLYTEDFKHPHISIMASTSKMFDSVIQRTKSKEGKEALAASVIKQIIHIGTDIYTPCGISLPGMNLVMKKEHVEAITRHIGYGELMKFGASGGLATLINCIIETLHGLAYRENKDGARKVYSVKTRKIIDYSNVIAAGSNIIKSGIEAAYGLQTGNGRKVRNAARSLDLATFVVCIKRIVEDKKYQKEVLQEFFREEWRKRKGGKAI